MLVISSTDKLRLKSCSYIDTKCTVSEVTTTNSQSESLEYHVVGIKTLLTHNKSEILI